MRLQLRPITVWPGELTRSRTASPFKATYTDTLQVLNRELDALGVVDNPVIQLAIREDDLRLDGELRANARPESHPGVILSFKSRKHGELSYPCDTFDGASWRRQVGWQQNLRAIVLGLEALRKVERYGIANRGQQYTGWKALGTGMPMGAAETMTVEEAARFLADQYPDGASADDLVMEATTCENREWIESAYRMAAKRLHPDAGGDPALFRQLTMARNLLVNL
jgi:hypothetical protein